MDIPAGVVQYPKPKTQLQDNQWATASSCHSTTSKSVPIWRHSRSSWTRFSRVLDMAVSRSEELFQKVVGSALRHPVTDGARAISTHLRSR
jgi:hypothetical protein